MAKPRIPPTEPPETGTHAEQGPGVRYFDSPGTAPGVNTDVAIRVSLNGRLIRIERAMGGEERYGLNWAEFDVLIGRVLTLADATFPDREQRKAFKDVVRQTIKEWIAGCIQDAERDAGLDRVAETVPWLPGVASAELGVDAEAATG